MFWKKKTKAPKQVQILQAYLLSSMPLISGQLSKDTVKAGIRVFILGMADMLRQSEQLSWEEFIVVCRDIFEENGILPVTSVEEYLEQIQKDVSENEDVAKVMRIGAQSIQMFVAERDTQAPMDLLSVPQFVENAESSFKGIAA